jgi:hypothetical protein
MVPGINQNDWKQTKKYFYSFEFCGGGGQA